MVMQCAIEANHTVVSDEGWALPFNEFRSLAIFDESTVAKAGHLIASGSDAARQAGADLLAGLEDNRLASSRYCFARAA
jgi:hypothetical protein